MTGQGRGSGRRDAEIDEQDLFIDRERPDSAGGVVPADRPLDPGDFEMGRVGSRDVGVRAVPEVDRPTVRIAFEGPPHPELEGFAREARAPTDPDVASGAAEREPPLQSGRAPPVLPDPPVLLDSPVLPDPPAPAQRAALAGLRPRTGSSHASPWERSVGSVDAADPAVAVQLPGALLIIDDLPAHAARRAAGLMTFGYTCRAVVGSGASQALTEQRFDAVVLDIPIACATGTALAERLAILGGHRGPVVLTTPVRLDERTVAHPQVVAPVADEALARAIERARASAGTDPTRVRREIAKRVRGEIELKTNVLRAVVLSGDAGPRRGRIRSMSRSGGLDVQIRSPLPLHCRVDVELTLKDGRRIDFAGRVLSIGEAQMRLQLELGPGDDRVLDAFVRHARVPLDGELEPVRIHTRLLDRAAGGTAGDRHLARRFAEIAERLDDNAAHQAFIQDCVKGQRLEFAVRCYRALKERAPDDERVHRYLKQVGTIVGFYALRRDLDAGAGPAFPRSIRWTLGLFILAVLVLWVLAATLR